VTEQAAAPRSWHFPATLLAVLVAIGIALGIAPYDRSDWLLENSLAAGAVLVLVVTWRVFPLSKLSYSLIFVFLVLHEIGAHYTYSEVPYDEWFRALTGQTLNGVLGLERNHYDRLVHFCYGLLLAYPMRELFVRIADARGFWGYMLPLDLVMSTSMIYELIEWGAAVVFGGDLGVAYVGTQGDPWDAQKDMLLATCGAVIALTLTAIVHWSLDRDFQREWAASLAVKHREPLGEVAVERLRNHGSTPAARRRGGPDRIT
jgi:putative membrane protein